MFIFYLYLGMLIVGIYFLIGLILGLMSFCWFILFSEEDSWFSSLMMSLCVVIFWPKFIEGFESHL